MNKIYCPHCDSYQNQKVDRKKEEFRVKEDVVLIDSSVAVCDNCHNEIFFEELDEKNLELAYEQYRKNHGLLSPSEIRSIRNKYGLSQRSLGRLLEWGEVTINRYENGAIQDSAHNEVLIFISKPENMLTLFEKKIGSLPPEEMEILRKNIESNIKNERGNLLEYCFYSFNSAIDEFSGYKKFDLQKMKDMIVYIVSKSSIFITKLNKLLWYSDFLYFKEFSVSITGSCYVHLPLGPIPDNYDFIISTMIAEGILNKEEIFFDDFSGEKLKVSDTSWDINYLTKYEIKIMDFVLSYFKDKNSKEISDISHQEEPYKKTNPGDRISYALTSELSLNFK